MEARVRDGVRAGVMERRESERSHELPQIIIKIKLLSDLIFKFWPLIR